MVPEPVFDMFFADTVKDEIAFGLTNLGIGNKDAVIDAALDEAGLLHAKTLYPRWLSREVQRLAIACVVAMQPAIIVLDEPTTGLDGDEARLSWRSSNTSRKGIRSLSSPITWYPVHP